MPTMFHLAGSIIYALMQWLIILIVTRFIGMDGVGYYALYLGLLVPVSIFTNHGLRIYIATDIENRFADKTYLSLRYLGVLVFVLLTIFFTPFVDEPNIFFSIILIKCFDALSEIEYGNWNRKRVLFYFTCSQLLRLALLLLLVLVMDLLGLSGSFYLFAFPLAIIIIYFSFDRKKSEFNIKGSSLDYSALRALFYVSSPLAFSGLIASLNVTVVRFSLDYYLDVSALAKYVYIQYYFTVASIVVLSISQVAIPYFSREKNISVHLYNFHRVMALIFLYGVGFVLCIIYLSNFMTGFIYGVEIQYEVRHRLFFSMGAFFSFLAIFANSILISMGRMRYILYSNFIFLLLTVFSSFLLVEKMGILGAFISFFIVSLVSFIVNIVLVYVNFSRAKGAL